MGVKMGQIFVSGTWRESKALPYKGEAENLGRQLARSGHDLACGPGTGIARHVIDGYRSVTRRGLVRFYLPREELMLAVEETVAEGSDEIVQTEFDYPVRNVWQVSQCDGLFILTGGDGALEEALPALIDYDIPVAVVQGAGPAARALERLVDIFPEWRSRLAFGDTVDALIEPFLSQVAGNAM